MKKLFLMLLSIIFLAVNVFSSDIKIPKNKDYPLEIIYYIDDDLQNIYEIYSFVSGSESDTQYIRFSINKKSLITKFEAEIELAFSSEKELDDFINYYFNSKFELNLIPDLFIILKQKLENSSFDPMFIEGENKTIEKVIYSNYISYRN